ncbi:PREDICTED: transcription termination factor MTEF18, mitochondrial [Ipomoea nil]|uniref:transcription termination factor MTEF18, mitochondrial n=1 Tax=Ipomoea nil TaxID=35883 RepID=UPI00090166B7|nr:PREDICTED: transcription termination factor MTEF18, mitochondrial [Ipomoea nil]
MMIHKFHKRVSRKMISQLNHALFSSNISVCQSGGSSSSVSQSLQAFTLMRNRSFRSSGLSQYSKATATESKISRVARNDAQAALFEYLHYTRGFDFVDAEHISKSSPCFLQKLLLKVENEEDVSRALSRFLRYHPINEFEPFFESLGLSPDEIALLLPRNLMFLTDNHLLFDNFHVLSSYGIPRSNIGKIYKEAIEVFQYGDGVLNKQLMACENLGLSRSTVIKLVSCSPTVLVGDVNNELFEVIEKFKKMGFRNDWIGSYLSSEHSYNWSRILGTTFFLSEVGYNEPQMGTLFKANPALLFEGSGKCTYVLVAQLLKLGLDMDEIHSLLLEYPEILSLKCTKRLWKAMNFLFEIGMETKDIAKIVSSHIQLLGSNSLKRPKTVLKCFKGDSRHLCQTITEDPLNLFRLASKSEIKSIEQTAFRNPANTSEKTAFLLKLGYVENSDEMTKALKMFRGRGDQLQERFDCLVEAGLDCNVVVSMVKKAPTLLNQTKDVLEKKLGSLEKHLGYPVESILSFPSYLCYDIDRINLRFSMYAWLKEKGVAKPMLSLSTLLACSEARFIKYFVDVHPEGPAMWESLKKVYHAS